jgi:hypothetical protein
VLVRKLKEFGFKGPYPGGKHSWMEKENIRLIIPNPHRGDIDVGPYQKDFETGQNKHCRVEYVITNPQHPY